MTKIPAIRNRSLKTQVQHVVRALEDKKALDITVINLEKRNAYTSALVIASATSDRHCQTLGKHVSDELKAKGHPADHTEGQQSANWVLVDAGDVVVHIFMPETRELYNLEKLWLHDFDADDDTTSAPRQKRLKLSRR